MNDATVSHTTETTMTLTIAQAHPKVADDSFDSFS